MARPRELPPNNDETIDADLKWALEFVKGEGDRVAKLGELAPLLEFHKTWIPQLRKRTSGDHWITRDRRLILKEIERRTDRLIGIAIVAGQERGLLNHRGWVDPNRLKQTEILGSADLHRMRTFARWPDAKFERILDVARKERVMSREALLRVEAGESASTKRKVIRRYIEDESTQRRIYKGAVTTMDGMAAALVQLGDIHPRITQGERDAWYQELSRHRAKLSRAMNKLRTRPRPPSPPPSSTSR